MLKFAEMLNRLVLAIVLSVFTVSFVLISAQVILRYLFNYGLVWGEELARHLNIFMVLLGSSIVIFEDNHPRIETLYEYLPEKYRKVLANIFILLTTVFLIVLVWQGISLCLFAWEDFTAALRIRWTFPYSCIPIGGLLMIFQLWMRHLKDATNV